MSFYNNGCKIMNATHQLIEDGDGLMPGLSMKHIAIIPAIQSAILPIRGI
jgi:hypothetical protein